MAGALGPPTSTAAGLRTACATRWSWRFRRGCASVSREPGRHREAMAALDGAGCGPVSGGGAPGSSSGPMPAAQSKAAATARPAARGSTKVVRAKPSDIGRREPPLPPPLRAGRGPGEARPPGTSTAPRLLMPPAPVLQAGGHSAPAPRGPRWPSSATRALPQARGPWGSFCGQAQSERGCRGVSERAFGSRHASQRAVVAKRVCKSSFCLGSRRDPASLARRSRAAWWPLGTHRVGSRVARSARTSASDPASMQADNASCSENLLRHGRRQIRVDQATCQSADGPFPAAMSSSTCFSA